MRILFRLCWKYCCCSAELECYVHSYPCLTTSYVVVQSLDAEAVWRSVCSLYFVLEIAVIGQSEFITCIDGVAGQIQLFRCAEADGICAIACGDPLIAVNISGEHHAVSACAEANSVAAQSKVLCHWVSFL